MREHARAAAIGLASLAAGVAIAFALHSGGSTDRAAQGGARAAAGGGAPAQTERVVHLFRASPPVSTASHLDAELIAGSVLAAGSEATVLADLDCTPDAQDISHCHNPLRLADGSRVEVIHVHSMAAVPCLAAGERVRLVWHRA